MGWWERAKPGDKIVYALDETNFDPDEYCPAPELSLGQVYTISNLYVAVDGDPMVEVVEASHEDFYPGYLALAFRPVQTKSTDTGMAMLKRILSRPHQRIEEDA